jgi:hypothetical protein
MLSILHYLKRTGLARFNVLGFVCLMVLSVVGSGISMSVHSAQMNPLSDHVAMMDNAATPSCHEAMDAGVDDSSNTVNMDCSATHCNHLGYMLDFDHLFVALKAPALFEDPEASPSLRASALFIPPRRSLV